MVPTVSRERVPAVLVVLVAVALVAGAGWLVYADLRPTYRLTATAVQEPSDDAAVLAYDALPSAARAAFDEARSGTYVVHHDPAFRETFPLYETVYVRADDSVYRAWASTDGLDGVSLLVAVPTIAVALGLAAVGGRSFRRRDPRLPLAVLAGLGGAWAAAVAFPAVGPLLAGGVAVVPAVVGFVALSTVAWAGLDRVDAA